MSTAPFIVYKYESCEYIFLKFNVDYCLTDCNGRQQDIKLYKRAVVQYNKTAVIYIYI